MMELTKVAKKKKMCSYLKSYSYPGQKRNSKTFSSISSLVTNARVSGTLRWGCGGWVEEAVEGAVPLKVQENGKEILFLLLCQNVEDYPSMPISILLFVFPVSWQVYCPQ